MKMQKPGLCRDVLFSMLPPMNRWARFVSSLPRWRGIKGRGDWFNYFHNVLKDNLVFFSSKFVKEQVQVQVQDQVQAQILNLNLKKFTLKNFRTNQLWIKGQEKFHRSQILNLSRSNHSLLTLAVIFSIFCSSCIGPKDLITLNANEIPPEDLRSVETISTAKPYNFQPYKIQPYDQLMIKINAFDGSTEDFLSREFSTENTFSSNINYDAASLYFNSYEVDQNGYIILPMIGRTKVSGFTLTDLKTKLDKDYEPYLKFANSNVKLSNRRFTIFGEVRNPGVHYLYNEKNTLFDAIGLAGDFTDFGNRKKVKIIRQTQFGSETTYLNLSQSDFMFTPYYYVQPNDVIYVEPLNAKSKEVSSRTLGVVFSGISVGVLLLNLFLK